jgi:hypothetical protein
MFLLERTVSGKVGNRRKTEPGTTGADFFAVRYRFACDRRYLRRHLFAFSSALGEPNKWRGHRKLRPEKPWMQSTCANRRRFFHLVDCVMNYSAKHGKLKQPRSW